MYVACTPTENIPRKLNWTHNFSRFLGLKVLTNEKRGGLTVILFDRSRFQLFTLKFSNKSVQSSSCEWPETAQRTLFLLFANNNCLPITLKCRRCKHRYWFFADTPNIARICRVIWKDLLWCSDTVFSNIREDVQYRCLNYVSPAYGFSALALVKYSNEGGPGSRHNMKKDPGTSTLIMKREHGQEVPCDPGQVIRILGSTSPPLMGWARGG